jgi:hypothetical protein
VWRQGEVGVWETRPNRIGKGKIGVGRRMAEESARPPALPTISGGKPLREMAEESVRHPVA